MENLAGWGHRCGPYPRVESTGKTPLAKPQHHITQPDII